MMKSRNQIMKMTVKIPIPVKMLTVMVNVTSIKKMMTTSLKMNGNGSTSTMKTNIRMILMIVRMNTMKIGSGNISMMNQLMVMTTIPTVEGEDAESILTMMMTMRSGSGNISMMSLLMSMMMMTMKIGSGNILMMNLLMSMMIPTKIPIVEGEDVGSFLTMMTQRTNRHGNGST
jgi:hypothetical protein